MTADEFVAFWDAFEKLGIAQTEPFVGRWYISRNDIRDINTLKRAGWTPEFPSKMPQPMSWYWRRALRPGTRDKKGKRFLSTSQALSDLRRQQAARADVPITQWTVELTIAGEKHRGSLPAKGFLNAQQLADSIGAKVIDNESASPTFLAIPSMGKS